MGILRGYPTVYSLFPVLCTVFFFLNEKTLLVLSCQGLFILNLLTIRYLSRVDLTSV